KKNQSEAIDTLDEISKDFSLRLVHELESEKILDERFKKLYTDITAHFKEAETPENIDSIANLALLDSGTNRSYKNAMFSIKRKTIIENDMNGVFVPICTKNVFLKSYSKKLGEVMYWSDNDSTQYIMAIKKMLKEFIEN
ncbi:MAG TPA: DUF1524 domain-containing protein, partial [Tenuifilaceae bacterium]|nr:DUF1524 domain-containing protein [Tenuifilaceae bacterium]